MGRYLSVSQCLRGILTYPMLAWDTHLPNACVGRQAFPMEAEGRLADFDRRIHPRQSEGCFVSLITQRWGLLECTGDGNLSTAVQAVTFVAQIHPPSETSPVPLV